MSHEVDFLRVREDVRAQKDELDKAYIISKVLNIMDDILGKHGLGMKIEPETEAKEPTGVITIYRLNDPEQKTWAGANIHFSVRVNKEFEPGASVNGVRQALYKCFDIKADS